MTIGSVACLVKKTNQTCITCETGERNGTDPTALVTVFIKNSGFAMGSVFFQYMDLWSSRWTWGDQEPPEAGTIVSVERGVTIYLDMSTPILKCLVIDNATLIFDDFQDISLNVEYIVIVNGGRLQIGTESNPFQHRAVITIYGHVRSIELPVCE